MKVVTEFPQLVEGLVDQWGYPKTEAAPVTFEHEDYGSVRMVLDGKEYLVEASQIVRIMRLLVGEE